jgi:MerR family transcriptional regulator, light-induced transcriptional regulator
LFRPYFMNEDTYQINDLEKLTGIKAHTIRIWEKRYNMLNPRRSDSNIRHYSANDLKKLLNISILNKKGLKISRIARLSDAEISARVIEFSNRSNEVEDQVQSLIMAMFHLDSIKFEKLITVMYINRGFENTFIDIICPFMSKVGLLWQTGTITIAHEHFASNIIRQKLIASIDSCLPLVSSESKNCVLFLPENEEHELGLLFAYYILKRHHHLVTYLGNSVPLGSITNINCIHQSDCIVTSITSAFSSSEAATYLETLALIFSKQKLLVLGIVPNTIQLILPTNIVVINHYSDLIFHV